MGYFKVLNFIRGWIRNVFVPEVKVLVIVEQVHSFAAVDLTPVERHVLNPCEPAFFKYVSS